MRGTAIGAGLFIVAACGGSTVVDPATTSTTSSGGSAGSGGTAGAGATTSSTTSSGGAGGTVVTCEQLTERFWETSLAALECNPALSVEQCTGAAMINDDCGCETVANEHDPEAVQEARDAYDAWVDGGCGPIPCEWCIPPTPAYCEPGSGSGTGMCVSAVN